MDDDISLPQTAPSDIDMYGGQKTSLMERMGGHLIEFIETFVVFGAIFAILYLFVAQPHRVSGRSMDPTFQDGDLIFTDKVTYKIGEIKRGDVIVLKNPQKKDVEEDFIKRVIALPGDTVKVENSLVYINGNPLKEDYLPTDITTPSGAFLQEGEEVKAGTNQYFAFGDNRHGSSDSRSWGALTKEEIIGRVFFRYWPPTAFGLIHRVN